MKENIIILEAFCDLTGLKTQGEKCHGFFIQPTKDSCKINDCPNWTINGTPINMIEPGSSEKYLGVRIDPWIGISKPELLEKLQGWLHRIGSSPLKPLQKTDILKGYTLPRLIYLADQSDVKATYLETLHLAIRRAVKEWLHLPPSTCDAILYSNTRDGGLGITRLLGLIPSVQVRRLHCIAQSSDEVTKEVTRQEGIEKEFEKLWITAGGDKNKIPSIWTQKPLWLYPRNWARTNRHLNEKFQPRKPSFLDPATGEDRNL